MVTLTIGLIILAVYLSIVMIVDKQIPASISDTFYMCGKWMFTFVMTAEAILLATTLISYSLDNWQWLGFISGAALAFVGAAPHFNESYEHDIHFGSAYTFAIGSLLWVSINITPLWLLSLLIVIPLALIYSSKKTFIEEIACVVIIALSIYTK